MDAVLRKRPFSHEFGEAAACTRGRLSAPEAQ